VSLVVASVALALALLFLTGLLRNLPRAVLAAIVLIAVKGLIDLREIGRLRQVSRLEFRVAMIALVGVLLLGILKGVLLAVIGSILLLLHRAAFPHVAVLGRIPNSTRFSDLERHPDNERTPGVSLFRVEASLLYFNVDHVLREVLTHVDAQPEPVRLVVLDLSTSPYVDLAGARTGPISRHISVAEVIESVGAAGSVAPPVPVSQTKEASDGEEGRNPDAAGRGSRDDLTARHRR
jgi:MFS superfamily sulfate permease-like transporter